MKSRQAINRHTTAYSVLVTIAYSKQTLLINDNTDTRIGAALHIYTSWPLTTN